MAISAGTALLGGAVLGGSLLSANAARKAGDLQARATDAATAEQRRQFDLTRKDYAPWLTTGQQAVRTIGDLVGLGDGSGELMRNFTGDELASEPGYAFRLSEGTKALENAARARGTFLSPSTVKELVRYGQDYASNEYQNAWNRDMSNRTTKFNFLSGVSGGGQQAANTLANAGAQTASTIGQLVTQGANARGAAGIASANAWNNGISTLGNWYMGHTQTNQLADALRRR